MRVQVKLEEKTFIVDFNDKGEPRSIKQRKLHAPGRPWECWHNAPYWHHSAKLGGPKTMPRRIIAEAERVRVQK